MGNSQILIPSHFFGEECQTDWHNFGNWRLARFEQPPGRCTNRTVIGDAYACVTLERNYCNGFSASIANRAKIHFEVENVFYVVWTASSDSALWDAWEKKFDFSTSSVLWLLSKLFPEVRNSNSKTDGARTARTFRTVQWGLCRAKGKESEGRLAVAFGFD